MSTSTRVPKYFLRAGVMCVFLLTHATASGGEPAAPAAVPSAPCSTAERVFFHPSMHCWEVFDQAAKKGDYIGALEAVRAGCTYYKRVDYCMFLNKWNVTPELVRSADTDVQRYRIRAAAERAAEFVTTTEIDDAEAPLHARAAELARQQSVSRKHGRLARVSSTRPRQHARAAP